MGDQKPVKKRKTIIAACAALLGLVLIILISTNVHAIKNQLKDWKLLPEPERLTELYFTHPNNLPTTYTPGQSQTVAFTVHNLEYKTEDYSYQIIENNQAESQPIILTTGTFVLDQNQYGNINNPVTLGAIDSRMMVEVKLTNVNESIDYWVNEASS